VKGYDSSLQVPPTQIHLTLAMLKLYSKDDLNRVSELMKKMSKKIYDLVDTRSVVVQFKGVEIMNDDPSAVDVLYMKGKVDKKSRKPGF
jgi:activating signal cointegrator complex subunit 1